MQGPLWSNCTDHAHCQSHLLKTTQVDSEAYLQEMQKDSDNKAASFDLKGRLHRVFIIRLLEHPMICLMLTT